MKCLLVASTVLLAVSVSSSARSAPTADVSPTAPPEIPYASYTSGRSLAVWYPEARALLREAQALEKEGKTAEALEKYRDAFRLEPYNSTAIELGLAEARAGHMLPCARNLQTALHAWTPQGNEGVRPIELLREVFSYCRKSLGAIAIKINVPDVRVTIDGEDVREWPYFSEIYVEPGKHAVKAMKDSYWMNQSFIEVGPGERKPLSIAMQAKYDSHFVGFSRPVHFSVNANLATAAKEEAPTWPRNLMIASSVGIGLGVGGLVTGLVQMSNAESKSAAATWTGVATVGGIVGAMSVAGFLIGVASLPTPSNVPNVIIQPQVSNDGGGVQLSGAIE